jgi:hypothetical protein
MKPGDVYSLRIRLLQSGYVPVPVYPDGRPALILHSPPSESGVRSWANRFERASLTGVCDPATGSVTIVTEVPAQLAAQRLSERQAREKTKNRQRKAAKRRAEGRMTRSDWLAAHSSRPWLDAGMSRSAWYRKHKGGTGVAG